MKTNSFDYNKSVSYKDEGMMIKTLKLCFKRKKKKYMDYSEWAI